MNSVPDRLKNKGPRGMACQKCGHNGTAVTDSRVAAFGVTRRRRICTKCEHRFTTIEICIGSKARVDFAPFYKKYEELSVNSRKIIRLIMDVLAKAEI